MITNPTTQTLDKITKNDVLYSHIIPLCKTYDDKLQHNGWMVRVGLLIKFWAM